MPRPIRRRRPAATARERLARGASSAKTRSGHRDCAIGPPSQHSAVPREIPPRLRSTFCGVPRTASTNCGARRHAAIDPCRDELLYVGLTRATTELVVIAPPELVRRLWA